MNFINLKGRTALITGSARRIGKAITLELGSRGVNILAHYHKSEEGVKDLLCELEQYDIRAFSLKADLRDTTQVENLFKQALQLSGPIDILINNASIFPENSLLDFSSPELHENIQINAFAPLVLCRRFYAQKVPGTIINLLDTRILDYDRMHVAYHLSKRMLFTLTRMLALEFAPGVRVNAIAPGVILPPSVGDKSHYEKMIKGNPLLTHGSLEDITSSVVFLLGNSFITGQVLYVDGGRHMRGVMYGS